MIKFATILMTIVIIPCYLSGTISYSQEIPLDVRVGDHIDLLFPCLSHMDIGEDAANLFSPAYINEINKEKIGKGINPDVFKKQLFPLKEIYLKGQKLQILNFLPFIFRSYEEMIQGMIGMSEEKKGEGLHNKLIYLRENYFISMMAKRFLKEFIDTMQKEYQSFYREYWNKRQIELEFYKSEFLNYWKRNGPPLLGDILKDRNKGISIFLCLSMTHMGRGFSFGGSYGAAVKHPESKGEIITAFFSSIHEVSHQFVDDITLKSIEVPVRESNTKLDSSGYKNHLLKEYAVIYVDYLLCKKRLPSILIDYLRQIMGLLENREASEYSTVSLADLEEKFKKKISLPQKTIVLLDEYLNRKRE